MMLEPEASPSRVKHSTTEPLRFPEGMIDDERSGSVVQRWVRSRVAG